MSERATRLGDVVDDYCPRCRLLLNHDVASLTGSEIAKVTCRTCHNTHDYRHAQVPTRRKKAGVDKEKLMQEVLAGLGRTTTAPAEPPPPAAAPASAEPPERAVAAPAPVRKRRDLWAELDRIQNQNKKTS
jgi:hypothetical protein